MSTEFPSQYLQANGNSSFTGANTQQINAGYEAQQHHSAYSWMGSDQQLVPNQTIISGATIATQPTTLNAPNVATTPSKTLYHTQSPETSNNFIPAQNTPVVGSNVRKPSIKQTADNNINANVNTPVATSSGITVGNSQNRTPEYIDYTQKCVQLILEINYELIRVCIDYQNKGFVNEQDLTLYKSRLQANLSYLATVADEYNGNSRNLADLQEFKQKMIPDLSPLPTPRSSYGQKINTLLQRANQIFAHQKKFQRINTNPTLSALANSNVPNNNNGSTSHMLDPSSTSPPRQFKMGQPSSNIMGALMNNPPEYQLYQKQQQQQPPPPTMPPQSQHPQQIQHQQKSQQSPSQPQQNQMLQQQQSQQLQQQQQQQSSQQSANRFNPMIPTATISTTYQQHHPTSQHQNMATTSNISDYTMVNAATNSEQSYQQVSLPPLAGMGNIPMGNAGSGNGGAGNVQGLPSIIGIGDQFGMPAQQQQLQQLQNVGYTGFIGGGGAGAGISGTGFGTTNTYSMMRYPSAGGNGMGNNPISGNSLAGNSLSGNSLAGNSLTNTVLGGGGNGLAGSGLANNMGGIMSGNNYGSNAIVGNTLGLPSMMNHDNGMG